MNRKVLIVVRALSHLDKSVFDQCQLLRRLFPDVRIIVSADCVNGHQLSGLIREISNLGVSIQSTTQLDLLRLELPYIGHQTGWLCGDYRLYSVLEFDWDYVWMVEPDVDFVSGADDVFREILLRNEEDLLAPRFRKAEDWWAWQHRLKHLSAYPDMYAMQFPFIRVSRELVEASLEFRQFLSATNSFNNQTIPNDESVLATVAGNGRYSTCDLTQEFPDLFKHFGTVPKYLKGDLEKYETNPSIVHSVVGEDKYWDYAKRCLELVRQLNPAGEQRFSYLVSEASPDLRARLLAFQEKFLEEMELEA